MKKLYNKKGKVHPTPPPLPLTSDRLAFLPATLLTLAAALTQQDREVLAYLLSCSTTTTTTTSSTKNTKKGSFITNTSEHPPLFNCNCFRCYTSYWVRWDSSPNRQLIHDIIDAFEDELTHKKRNKKDRKKKKPSPCRSEEQQITKCALIAADSQRVNPGESHESVGGDGEEGGEEEGDLEKGSVRKFVSFIGETIWGVWN